jgi:hypothetical protein
LYFSIMKRRIVPSVGNVFAIGNYCNPVFFPEFF